MLLPTEDRGEVQALELLVPLLARLEDVLKRELDWLDRRGSRHRRHVGLLH